MSTAFGPFETVFRYAAETQPEPTPSEWSERINALYALSQRSSHIFASPLGAVRYDGRHLLFPRFVYFGPHTHDESLRLAFYGGFDHRDLRSSFGLLHLVERLALNPSIGQGLNLSFFPLVDVVGRSLGVTGRNLETTSWQGSGISEIDLLQKDARTRGYHGFIRVEVGHGEETVTARLRGDSFDSNWVSGVELISSEDFDPLDVRWEADLSKGFITDGPLTLSGDLPFQAFELTLRIPASWNGDLHREAIASILKRFILRYRSLQAYAQHL